MPVVAARQQRVMGGLAARQDGVVKTGRDADFGHARDHGVRAARRVRENKQPFAAALQGIETFDGAG